MSAGRPNPEWEALRAKCADFSASPPNSRPIDALWHQYANNPGLARIDFDTHLPEYAQSSVIRATPYTSTNPRDGKELVVGVPGRLKVVAAYGGTLLASSYHDEQAEATFAYMQPRMRQVGRTVLGQVIQSIGETRIKGAGSALGLYLAANTADNQGLIYQKHTRSIQAVDELWPNYLQIRYQKATGTLASLCMAYAEVAYLTGALLKYHGDQDDPISRRHIWDFVGSCLRMAKVKRLESTNDIHRTTPQVTRVLGPRTGRMFEVAATLAHQRNDFVRGYSFEAEMISRYGLSDDSQPYDSPRHTWTHSRPTGPSYDTAGSGQSTGTAWIPKYPTGYANTQQTHPSWLSEYTPGYMDTQQTRFIGRLLRGPLDEEIKRAAAISKEGQRSYPWVALYTALAFRQATQRTNRSEREMTFLRQNEKGIAEFTVKQLLDTRAADIIRNSDGSVRPDYLGAAIEIRPWLTRVQNGEVQSRAVTPERASQLLDQLNSSLTEHLRRRYYLSRNELQNNSMREALLQLILFDNSGLRNDTTTNHPVLVNLYDRVTNILRAGRINATSLQGSAYDLYEELAHVKQGWYMSRYA